jgi:hypothetical protein
MSRTTAQIALLTSVIAATAACSNADTKDDMGSASTASAAQAGAVADVGAEYTVVFKNTWTKASHPFEYPPSAAIGGPHFSGIVGAAHNASYSLFADGGTPTAGLERLSEEGKPSPLDEEIRAAITAGTVSQLFTTGPLRDLSDSLVSTVRVNASHPLISLVAMIAPSPDWFAGIASVNLMENGAWSSGRTVQLYAYDSGGDEGMTYKASDRDNNPKKPTTKAMTRHFAANGTAIPVATVTFTKR